MTDKPKGRDISTMTEAELREAGVPYLVDPDDLRMLGSAVRRARPAEKGDACSVKGESSGRASVVKPLAWYDQNADNPAWIKALAEVRHLAPREGWCYPHVQAIIIAIDQYAEAALGNREFFLNKPYGIGGRMKDDIP